MDFASAFLSFLASAAVRSLGLAVAPLILLAVLGVRSAATRHAVLFLTAAGMMTTAALHPLLPAIPLRVLAAPAPAETPAQPVPIAGVNGDAGMPQPVSVSPHANLSLAVILEALYLAGLAFCLARLLVGALFTRRLINAAAPIEADLGPQVYESSWISVPFTVGWLCPRILLPAAWRDWTPAKLEAVLAHERNHVRRGDWAISVVAALNRSVYWFNPLAWWLERRLASLAEQACDDAALLSLGCREAYAEALLDMAAAVQNGQGRRVWEAMAMAKGAEVRIRIDRILDDSRPIPRGLTRSRWITLATCSLPLIYFTAAVHPAPAQSREQVQGISPGRNTPLSNSPASAQETFPAIPTISPAPTPVYKVDPVYPPLAREARIEGTVAVAVVIAPDGKVRDLRVLRGHPLLLQAALDAVKQWTFPPVSQAGSFEQDVTFSLLSEEGASPQDVAQIAHTGRAAV